jgi:hypothetical protein
MNSGQSFLIIGAFAILSTMTLNVNGSLVHTSTLGLEMEATLDAVSIAQTLMDEVLTQDFDQNTRGDARISSYASLTSSANFGPDGTSERINGDHGVDTSSTGDFESRTKFNDVDDYNGYTRRTWNTRFGWFTVSTRVSYVNEDNPSEALSNQTFYKCITVTVTQPNLVKDSREIEIPYVAQNLAVYRRYF